MLRITGVIAIMASVAAVSALPMSAATAQSPQSEPSATTAEKPPTARQQKMKECAAKWKEEKATKHVSGRAAYRDFMKECLKG